MIQIHKSINFMRLYGASFMFVFFLTLGAVGINAAAAPGSQKDTNKRVLLKIIDYIGPDYKEAAWDGKVVSQEEYDEMVDFSESALALFDSGLDKELQEKDRNEIRASLLDLQAKIKNKAVWQEILDTTRSLSLRLTEVFHLQSFPNFHPNLQLAETTYQNHCASCHGDQGRGDGAAGYKLEPAPRDFHDLDVMNVSTPFKFYNIMLTGVEGTSMNAYKEVLSEEELWSVAFYLSSLRFKYPDVKMKPPHSKEERALTWKDFGKKQKDYMLERGMSVELLSSSTDRELEEWFRGLDAAMINKNASEMLKAMRSELAFEIELPLEVTDREAVKTAFLKVQSEHDGRRSEHTKVDAISDESDRIVAAIDETLGHVARAEKSYREQDFDTAQTQLLEAYLFSFEKTEVILSLVDKKKVLSIEQKFMDSRAFIKNKNNEKFYESIHEIATLLRDCKVLYLEYKEKKNSFLTVPEKKGTTSISKGNWSDFISSFIIIVREGFEAFLVVAALLALLAGIGAHGAKLWVHAGWFFALVAGFVSYYLIEAVFHLSGAAKETIEAICTGTAVVVLFYTGFWLLNQAEQKKWHSYVKDSSRNALTSGNLWSLFFISFLAVYREAAETVLFYKALYSYSSSSLMITLGFVLGVVVLIGVCWSIVHFNLKLPLKQFFRITSSLMVILSIILAGKTVRELVEAGYIQGSPLPGFPTIDVLGVYPNWQSLMAQLVLILFGTVMIAAFTRKKKGMISSNSQTNASAS